MSFVLDSQMPLIDKNSRKFEWTKTHEGIRDSEDSIPCFQRYDLKLDYIRRLGTWISPRISISYFIDQVDKPFLNQTSINMSIRSGRSIIRSSDLNLTHQYQNDPEYLRSLREYTRRPPRQQRWIYEGPDPLTDWDALPEGWNDQEPDLDPL